jgi:hypothetical protein
MAYMNLEMENIVLHAPDHHTAALSGNMHGLGHHTIGVLDCTSFAYLWSYETSVPVDLGHLQLALS